MAGDLAKYAKDNKIKFFLFNFTDLFGTQRAKLVPAEAAGKMQKAGAKGTATAHALTRF